MNVRLKLYKSSHTNREQDLHALMRVRHLRYTLIQPIKVHYFHPGIKTLVEFTSKFGRENGFLKNLKTVQHTDVGTPSKETPRKVNCYQISFTNMRKKKEELRDNMDKAAQSYFKKSPKNQGSMKIGLPTLNSPGEQTSC